MPKIGNVLVVEDDRQINELLGAYVGIAGFGYLKALNGTTALRKARAQPPALIILDLMLPDIDGLTLLERFRAQASTACVPIIILSALDREEAERHSSRCLVAAYMTKPFDPDALIAAIRRHAAAPR